MKMPQKAQFCASEKNPVSDMDIDHMQDCGNTMPALSDPVSFHSGQVERTSDGGKWESQCIAAYCFDKNLSRRNASIFIYKLAVSLYFMILHLISDFYKCTALFWG